MPQRVHLPDGRIVNFPDAMTPDQIQAAMVTLTGGAKPAEPAEALAPSGTVFGKTLRPDINAQIEAAPMMAEPLVPNLVRGAQAVGRMVPSMARAGRKFEQVMGAAKDLPVDISAPGNIALRIQQLAERGGSMPKAVRDFLRRVTDPEKGPLRYEEAQDFVSNISRLSADETRRLAPAVRRELGNLRVALRGSIEKTAATKGLGETYRSAVKDYARAAKARDFASDVGEQLRKWAIPGGIVMYGARKLSDLVRGE